MATKKLFATRNKNLSQYLWTVLVREWVAKHVIELINIAPLVKMAGDYY